MILNDFRSMPVVGRALPRVGASLFLAASLFGAAAGQVVHADGPASAGTVVNVDGAQLPFIVCGIDSHLQAGGQQSILVTSGGLSVSPAQIDPAAIGQTFSLHGRSVADCGAGAAFQGLADPTANAGSVSLPASLGWLPGNRAVPTMAALDALSCAFSSTQGCTMLVPVAAGSDAGQLQSVIFAVMEVNVTGVNSHSGILLGDSSALSASNS